jgi:hypothetical protein
VFYPDQFKSVELGGEWFLDQVAIAIAIWVALGVVFTLLTFRWIKKS